MDPEQLVAQLAELRTQNQQLHQALQQVQQQQSQQQGLVQALSDLPQSLAQTVGAAVLAAASPARATPTLDTKGLGKPPPLKNTESEFVSWARRTENFVVSIHPGARDVLTRAVERESATVTEAKAATEVVMPLDNLRMLADQLYTVLMTLVDGESFDIFVGSGPGGGLEAWRPLDDWKSKKIAQRNHPFPWTCQAGRAARSSGHQLKDCWTNLGRWPQQQSQGQSNSLGKGNDAKGKSSGECGGKKRKIQRCWSTGVESTTESGCELSGIVYTTDGNKHNGWHG